MLLYIAVVMFLFMQFLVTLGQTGGDTLTDNLWLAISAIVAGGCILFSALIGIVAIFKQHERSFIIFLASIFGFVLLIFLVGEFTFPH